MDQRIQTLAQKIVTYSVHLEKGDHVFIDLSGFDGLDLVEALVEESYKAGAFPYVRLNHPRISRAVLAGATSEQYELDAKLELERMKQMNAYIGIGAGTNIAEFSDIPSEQLTLKSKAYSAVLKERVDHSKWVVLRYPNPSMAQLANMSSKGFEDFYFAVCTLDYAKMSLAMDALIERMESTDQVHIKGPGTDLYFSIKGIPAIKCAGEANLPDGEVYTAPVRNSVNGTITYNTPSTYRGSTFENVSFTFENGKITAAHSNHPELLDDILNTDEGARYIGEFAFGLNPLITKAMNDILFDEKIAGSIHFTPGASYDDASNGNDSDVHWDLVLLQNPENGGGEIYFDGELIRKDGLFIPENLHPLNPNQLLN